MKPEEKARQKIDQLLESAGWKVQNLRELDLGSSLGVAVREFPLESGTADYLLFADKRAVGVVEAKPEGTTLSGVANNPRSIWQVFLKRYLTYKNLFPLPTKAQV
ncbi:MAG: type I restriction enzyme EcoKI subunit R [Candidatus Methanolliviera sp. GoM_asphalt]|nr:MAG: type I restriction enzyme EcoKI subunit R [Candidatus Methanolliviera sp. GoM_asphalt]